MIQRQITYCGKPAVLACDGNCQKAWGINNRPRVQLDPNDEDDYAFLADDELGTAPADPGTYEGGHGKPDGAIGPEDMNKWCGRECERSGLFHEFGEIQLPDFSKRLYNCSDSDPASK